MRKLILIAAVVLSLLLAGCIAEEKMQQEVKFFMDITTTLGVAGKGTQFQELESKYIEHWWETKKKVLYITMLDIHNIML